MRTYMMMYRTALDRILRTALDRFLVLCEVNWTPQAPVYTAVRVEYGTADIALPSIMPLAWRGSSIDLGRY